MEDNKERQKRCMISQPMRSAHSDEEILRIRDAAKEKLEADGWEVIDTFFQEEYPNPTRPDVIQIPVAYLSKSIMEMSTCDAVYFCKGWEEARGCRIEHTIAEEYGLITMHE